jgi:hypothetical protein
MSDARRYGPALIGSIPEFPERRAPGISIVQKLRPYEPSPGVDQENVHQLQ